ncbi:hypothetical protein FPV67DRAFT_1453459 [Lyophyllum atratum]|nr:hypothetical protein FPV67DRAFT_1453459 [Lyophyllum atratum]
MSTSTSRAGHTRVQLEKVVCLNHRTARHSPPKIRVTTQRLGDYMKKYDTHIHVPGRTTSYTVPDVMGEGIHVTMTKKECKSDTEAEATGEAHYEMTEVEEGTGDDEMGDGEEEQRSFLRQ